MIARGEQSSMNKYIFYVTKVYFLNYEEKILMHEVELAERNVMGNFGLNFADSLTAAKHFSNGFNFIFTFICY